MGPLIAIGLLLLIVLLSLLGARWLRGWRNRSGRPIGYFGREDDPSD